MIPDVSDALVDWTNTIQLNTWVKSASDYQENKVSGVTEFFDGVLQPTPPSRLLVKPEGQRSWHWWTLYTTKDLVAGAEVTDPQGRRFKVMSVEEWPNVKIYELTQEPQ